MKKRLRVGIILDKYEIPAWSFKMLSEIINGKSSKIVLIVKNSSSNENNYGFFNKVYQNKKQLVYYLFRKLDKKFFKTVPDAFESKNIKSLLNIDSISVNLANNNNNTISGDDVNTIKKHEIDIFINLGLDILPNETLELTKYGVWSYYHSNLKTAQRSLFGFWEVIDRWDETGVTLQVLSPNGGENMILSKSTSLTDNLSVERNRNNYYWGALSILPRKIDELYRLGESEFFNRVNKLNKHPSFYSDQLYTVPNNRTMLLKWIKFNVHRASNIFNSWFYFDQWILLFKIENQTKISKLFFQFTKLLPPKDRFWADPHIIRKNNKYYIFIEELIYSEGKGFISVIEMDENGRYNKPVKILEEDYHLSYPFIIEDKGEIYMIPESKENNNIQMYKCISFPNEWAFETILIDNIKAVDTTIIFQNGRYWLFTNIVENQGASANDQLFLYSSNNLVTDNWISHPMNPIVSDVKNARPAGKLFNYKGNLYRPSQNCSKRYGYGMRINEILAMDDDTFKEVTVDSIYPNWDKKIKSTHSLSNVDNLTVIDALFRRRK